MSDPRDQIEFSWRPRPAAGQHAPDQRTSGKRFLSIWFRCCHVYGRIYRSTNAMRYEGRCPSCGAYVYAGIGDRGTDRRMFEAR